MIGFLKGQIISLGADDSHRQLTLLVEQDSDGRSGIGYEISCVSFPETCVLRVGEKLQLWIHTVTREDGTVLYGFKDSFSREVYRLLLTVSGVGPKMAAGIVGQMEARDVLHALASGQPERFHVLSGVGKKTAERLVLELKDKVHKKLQTLEGSEPSGSMGSPPQRESKARLFPIEALQGLLALGFQEKEALNALQQVTQQGTIETGSPASEKRFIQLALKILANPSARAAQRDQERGLEN